MITYRIQQTAKGDFIVRNPGDREMARFDTEPEAQAWIDQRNADEQRESESRATSLAEQEQWDRATPELFDAQLRWQEFRNAYYGELQAEGRRVGRLSRMAESLDSELVGTAHQRTNATNDQLAHRTASELYEQATALDTRIKDARRARDTEALTDALAETDALMEAMNEALPSVAAPKKASRAGTKPNTSIVLTPEELDYIERKFGGSKSAAIHEALRRLMNNGNDSN
mgnify:FL=1